MIPTHDSKSKTSPKAAVLGSLLLLSAAVMGFGQAVNLTAGPATTTLPDGTTLPMWGYTCSAAIPGSTATCAPLSGPSSGAATGALGGIYVLSGGSGYSSSPTVTITPALGNTPTTPAAATAVVSGGTVVGFNVTNHGAGYTAAPTVTITDATGNGAAAAAGPAWSPVVITVPWVSNGASLTINLTNNLSFSTGGGSANNIPTSIVIVGQVGGGLGSSRTTTQSPNHANAQGCVTWFIASGATPPGTPCTAQQDGASGVPPAQGPRVQSMSTEVAAAAPGTATSISLPWTALRPGTYLIESGTHPSIQVPMGLIGMLVVTTAPTATSAVGTAYPAVLPSPTNAAVQAAIPAVQYNAEVPLEFSEIDPVQNKEVDLAVRTPGFSESAVWTRMNAFGPVTSLTLTNPGSGYTSTPTVSIGSPTSGSAVPATATATVGAVIAGITATGGTMCVAPTVSITDSTGSGAQAIATVAGNSIQGITVTNPGSLYTSPTVTVTDPGNASCSSPAVTATASLAGSYGRINSLTLTNAGEGYTSAPPISITGAGLGATASASITLGGCGGTGSHTCYPPAVDYTPFYFLINGLAFDKSNAGKSLFAAVPGPNMTTTPPTPITGNLLVRLVNAGLRMHVPAIVGSQTTGFTGAGVLTTPTNPVSGFTLIAEDGNPLPNLTAPRVKTEVFMAAGKTYDVMFNVPAIPSGASAPPPAFPIYDRELSLSANSSVRDAGMLAYIGVNGGGLPVVAGTGVFSGAQANPDTYAAVVPCGSTATSCVPLNITDPSRGVIANDVNVNGVELSSSPTNGTLTCNVVPGNPTPGICANGTFTYTPNPGWAPDTFGYCANGATAGTTGLCTTVTLSASALVNGKLTAGNIAYISKMATFLKIPSPGPLSVSSDANNLPITVVTAGTAPPPPSLTVGTGTLSVDPQGGFTFSPLGGGTPCGQPQYPAGSTCYSFNYYVQNSFGTASTAPGTVTMVFPPPSHLQVRVVDAQNYRNCNGDSTCIAGLPAISDYRWIIEEDKTFWVDPNCTANSSITTPGCPTIVGPAGQSTVPTFGVQFHTSNMDYVAQGCTGPLSCEAGQTMLDTNPNSSTYGQHILAICDLGNGACRPDPDQSMGTGFTQVTPDQVALDPSKRYYISVLPGDAANPFPAYAGQPQCSGPGADTSQCGHTMSGAPIPPACNILGGPNACTSSSDFSKTLATVLVLPSPLPTGKLSVVVFEDDFPLNGEQDNGGGIDVVAPNEPGLGGFNIVLWDTFGSLGDVTGQDTYDMFNQPLSNSLSGTIDPSTGFDACPVSANATQGPAGAGSGLPGATNPGGITGMIVTCPKYESDGQTLSPLAGQAVIANLMPDKFSVQAYPGADRIARGEEWIQTNTLDGQHPHDSFIRIGEPSYFQEYGPAGYHVAIGFANPAIINARHANVCAGAGSPGAVGPCTNTIDGQVDVERLSRTPDQRLYPSGSRDALTWTQCWVSLGDPDGEDFQFTKCDANGNFAFTNVPGGNWRLTIGDQWNDQIIDGLSTAANVGCVPQPPATTCSGGLSALHMGNIGVQQWQANLYTRTFIDDNKNGIPDPGEIGIPLIYTMIHYRDGSRSNALTTDFNGVANFNETFPLFNWYVVEADSTRYKTTGIHTVYDAGGPADGSSSCKGASRPCGKSTSYNFLSNTYESVPLPSDLSVPGAVYCATADCSGEAASFAAGTAIPSSSTASTGRIDPPWVWAEGWNGLTSGSEWIEFGKAPYASCDPSQPVSSTNFCATVMVPPPPGSPSGTQGTTTQVGENGGIYGQIQYASTRPFDDAAQMIQQPWEPYLPRVTVNLYQEGFAADGVTPTLTMVDTTQSSSWDDWAQGFYPNYTDPTSGTPLPYMSCPGQGTNVSGSPNQDLFYFTLFDQPNYLDWYNTIHSGGTTPTPLPYNSQYKCYDAMHIGNQVQPAPYDGRYSFPSSLGINPASGKLVATKGSTNGVASSMNGTNCTICVGNPDSSDNYRYGTPMLPPGKYVVQVVMPPGYEVYKEEDKNLLIGDNYIAPVTQEFGGLGTDIFILPDQATVDTMYDPNGNDYNPNNFQDQTTTLNLQGGMLSGVPGFPGYTDPVWPCVGEMRVVPDYLSLFPHQQEVAPFAGASRPLCDRKEVNLTNQMAVRVKFALFTSTHIASKYTGVITDDFTSEFDPFAPQFGEKFAPPNMSISTKDYLGNELSRVYSDHWGIYDGLTFSSWAVNPPNITGYSPSMMTQCMNDPGPVLDTNPSSPTFGQMITDPLYNPAYSDFCYEEPYMPGLTAYLDTPVVPTAAFVGAGYNNADCSYPDATPAIKEVDGDGIGPWVSKAGNNLTITALGDLQVNNNAYSGPSANVAPFNQKTITRHYGFGGSQGSGLVTIGGVKAQVTSWSDNSITVNVPTGVPNCAIKQQAQYQGLAAQCGELVITAGNGKQSIDTITVTIGGKAPTHVGANSSVQSAIDAAAPGDLIMVDPGTHTEMLLMWKPVRLQGVGAASSVINANAFPAGTLLDPWRRHVNCLFGLTLSGVPYTASTGAQPYDPSGIYSCPDSGWNYFTAQPNNPQVDRMPLEATVGWDATLNGNLAEQLQEPSLMGAFEGAGITILAKGVDFHGGDPWGVQASFPAGTTLLTGVGADPTALPVGDANPLCTDGTSGANRFPSNFTCNPSSIDGLSIVNSSQGGGGIFAHGWAHHLEVSNDRVYNNAGTLTGGISIGQGEFAEPYLQGGTNNPPGSCSNGAGLATNEHLPDCYQIMVNVHNNYVTNNSSLGDELFSGTLSGGGGATFCTGNDYYKFNFNWVCGNLSSGEGGGLVHLGEIQSGDIENNSFVLNQSDNPTIPTNGGAIQVMGTPDTDPVCGAQPDADCPPGLSDGTGRGLIINANLIQGNMSESGSGGGIRLQSVNGTDVSTFPSQPTRWNDVTVTNNIIVNNVAGWDGGGISLEDSLKVIIRNNTIASNDTLASSGVLTQSIGTPVASAPAGNCVQNGPSGPTTASCPQSAGVTSMQNSPLLTTSLTGLTITCPSGITGCKGFSNPLLQNNVIWQNRAFYIGVGTLGTGNLNQQNQVSLFNAFGTTPAPNQSAFGQCNSGVSYWDVGVRGDTGPGNHASGFTLNPTYSVLDDTGYAANNIRAGSTFVSQYCNGSRVPPNCSLADGCGGPSGYGVPPGIVDASAPNPVFSLTPSATVDEGNNWINVSWGPLSLSDDSLKGADGNYGGGPLFANYAWNVGSQAIDYIPATGATAQPHPTTDFFGNPRPDPGNTAKFDVGAIEYQIATPLITSFSPNPLLRSTAATTVTISGSALAGASAVSINGGITCSVVSSTASQVTASCTSSATAAAGSHNVTVTATAGSSPPFAITLVVPTLTSISPTSGSRGVSNLPMTLTGSNLQGATSITVTGAGVGCTITTPAPTSTTVHALCTIANSATTNGRNVSVVTSTNGTTGNVTFNVLGGTATFSGPSPSLVTGTTTAHSGTITVRNTATGGNAGPITLTAAPTVTKVGTAGGSFAITGGTCANGTVINAGGSCTIVVTYTPSGTTTATANVTITATGLATATQTSANFTAN